MEHAQIVHAAGGYGPPGGGYPPPGGGGGFGGPPPGAPPGGGGYGGPPPGGPPPGGGGFGGPPPGGYGGPPPGGFGGPPGYPPPGGGGGGGEVNTTLPLILGIASFFCGCGLLAGIPIYFAVQAKNLAEQGQIEEARSKAKTATILSSVGIGVGLLGAIAYIIMVVVIGANGGHL